MIRNKKLVSASGIIILLLVLGNVITLIEAYTSNEKWYWVLVLTLPLLILAIINVRRKKHAILCNERAKRGSIAHNTGEGGISEYDLHEGDRIWQIGPGYWGCRDENGRFNAMAFRKNALHLQVKMIELTLSQSAKPGHGGILPAKPGLTIHSPARHSEFDTPVGMVMFLDLLRELSGGKPVGFKICIGDRQEFIDICNAIKATGCIPDFISVDGGEGGTGAAPLEFTDHPGMPLHEALAFVKQTLDEFDLASQIKIFAAGEIITGFDERKVLSLGAKFFEKTEEQKIMSFEEIYFRARKAKKDRQQFLLLSN